MNNSHADVLDPIVNMEGVSRAWFEWSFAKSTWEKTLVVEVDFDTDPSSGAFRRATLEEIEKMAQSILEQKCSDGRPPPQSRAKACRTECHVSSPPSRP